MREILFRGKENPGGEWVEGFLVGNSHIGDWVSCTPIHSKTVGQFTGLTDKNGTKIFEGDILRYWSSYREEYGDPCVVEYGAFNCTCCDGVYGWYLNDGDIRDLAYENPNYVVVGNIYDNPELLEVDK